MVGAMRDRRNGTGERAMSVPTYPSNATALDAPALTDVDGREPAGLDEREPMGVNRSRHGSAVAPSRSAAPFDRVRYSQCCGPCCGPPHPAVDLTKVIVTGEVVVGAVAVAWRLANRPSAPKAHVTMGPGGWVSLKGGGVRLNGRRYRPSPSSDTRRPVWARLLYAYRIT
jgi:hypothetical protein